MIGKIRSGIIGYGEVGDMQALVLKILSESDLDAACDKKPERSRLGKGKVLNQLDINHLKIEEVFPLHPVPLSETFCDKNVNQLLDEFLRIIKLIESLGLWQIWQLFQSVILMKFVRIRYHCWIG